MSQLDIGSLQIEVVKKDIKNLHLGVYPPNGRVRIAVPLRTDDEAVRLFAISKLAWIKKQQEKFINQERQSWREYVSGENHYYNGRRYRLRVVDLNSSSTHTTHSSPSSSSQSLTFPKSEPPQPSAAGRSRVEIRNKKYLYLFVPKGSSRDKREGVLNGWYRARLKEILAKLIEKWKPIIGVDVSFWGIKIMKTKWGSCNSKLGRIWFNLELAKKPMRCIEYIVVHEMVHLLERNHGEKFRGLMDRFMPQWAVYKEELNRIILGHVDW